mmetsp:Transcript_17063/g.50376  ORF Transcript_17063/g.50376 Transcript_17063/m.50376 type:complete len:213 (-) Transcript_17063:57-695(-)
MREHVRQGPPHHGGGARFVNIGHLAGHRPSGDLKTKEVIGVCTVPLDQWNHVQAGPVVHLAPIVESRPKRSEPFCIVACIAPRPRAPVVGPRWTGPHVGQDVIDSTLGGRHVSEVHVPHDHLLLPCCIKAELASIRICLSRPVFLPVQIACVESDHERSGVLVIRSQREGRVSGDLDLQRVKHLSEYRPVHEAWPGTTCCTHRRFDRAPQIP